jgi:hypothetical protein
MKFVSHEQGELAMLEVIAFHPDNISVLQLDFVIGWDSHLGII